MHPRPLRSKARRLRFAATLGAILVTLAAGVWLMADLLLRVITPSGGASVTRSVAFMPGPRGTLDITVPKHARGAPLVVFFYGGRWQFGGKSQYGFVANALASRGMIAIVPDYRLYPDVGFPEFLKDGAAAVRWAVDNAAQLGGDPGRIFVMGHSAGAHIAAMLALDSSWLAGAGLDARRDIAGLIGLSGPYDFLPLEDPRLIDMFGGAGRAETQPVTFASAAAPPSFLATGDKDDTVKPRNTMSLSARLRAHGVRVEGETYPGRGHAGTILALLGPLRFLAPVLDDVARFVQATPSRAG